MADERDVPRTQREVGEASRAEQVLAEAWNELASLGVETKAERRAKLVVPWLVSFSLHAALILLGFVITWTVVMMQDEGEPAVIVAEFDALSYDPVTALPVEALEVREHQPREIDLPAPEEIALDPLLPPVDLGGAVSDSSSLAAERFVPAPVSGGASFLGVRTTNARRIVYVIDASGTMIAYIQLIIRELAKSLDAMSAEQSFGIVFFQRNNAVIVPPRRLVPGTAAEKSRSLEWIEDNVIPAGLSDPIPAFEAAFAMNPDVIFVLSANITGTGIYEVDQRDLLARLEELNPAKPPTGRRPTQINCIQFLDPDPLDTLRVIANRHGGADGYKFFSREELGLAVP